MVHRRALLGLLVAALAMFYALGASTVALACAASRSEISARPPLTSDCADHGTMQDCGLSCAPMCAAAVPASAEAAPPPIVAAPPVPGKTMPTTVGHSGPEPPPPRVLASRHVQTVQSEMKNEET